MQFPLYTSLSKNLPSKDLSAKEKKTLIDNISKLDFEAQEIIFVLIKSYYTDNEKNQKFNIPYNGQIYNNRIDFDLEKFPIKLKHIIKKFLFLHEKKIAEDRNFHSGLSTEENDNK